MMVLNSVKGKREKMKHQHCRDLKMGRILTEKGEKNLKIEQRREHAEQGNFDGGKIEIEEKRSRKTKRKEKKEKEILWGTNQRLKVGKEEKPATSKGEKMEQ